MSTPQIILCPGQGAQHVGMGKAWADKFKSAAETFAEADAALGYSISKLCFEGPEADLNKTDRAQVAIYVTSVACHRALAEQGKVGTPAGTAGLSLGEFTALHLAGAFSFQSGLSLVKLRGEAMQAAAEATPSGMVAVTGLGDEQVAKEICRLALEQGASAAVNSAGPHPSPLPGGEGAGGGAAAAGPEVLVPANFNSPIQIVLSGSKGACERAAKIAEEKGFKPTILAVAGAFHSPIMQPAAEELEAALNRIEWGSLKCPVLSNVTALPHDGDVKSIRQRLVEQLTSPVRWASSMQWAVANLPGQFIELAPGKTLMGLMRRIDKAARVENHAEPG